MSFEPKMFVKALSCITNVCNSKGLPGSGLKESDIRTLREFGFIS